MKNIIVITGMIFLSVMIYNRWFFLFQINTVGDWRFFFAETQKIFFDIPFIWSNVGLGKIDIGLSSYLSMILTGSFYSINNFAITERIIFFYPSVIFAAINSYILCKNIFSKKAAFVSSLLYSYNSYFLIGRTGHLTLMVAFAIAPLIFYFFKRTIDEKKIHLALITGLLCVLCSGYEFRAFYIVLMLLFAYYLFDTYFSGKTNSRKTLSNSYYSIIPIFSCALINLFWILGLAGTNDLLSNEIFERGLFGNQYMNIVRSITLFHPFWNGSEPHSFVTNPIPLYYWIVPMAIFLGLILNVKNRFVLFFGIISVIGILLNKQSGEPYDKIYSTLYSYLPGFNAFREASKFYFLIAVGYTVLTASFIDIIWKYRYQIKIGNLGASAVSLLIIFTILLNTKPIITGEIGTLYIQRSIPNDYILWKNFVLEQNSFSRSLWIPIDSKWSIYTNVKPKIQAVSEFPAVFKIVRNRFENNEENFIKQQIRIKAYLDQSSISHVIIPIEDISNDDNFFPNYEPRNFYISQLDKLPFLRKIDIGTEELVVYENADFKPHIYSTSEKETLTAEVPFQDLTHSFINPTEYKITLNNIEKPLYLNFSENYHPDWNLRAGDFNWFDVLKDKNYFIDASIHSKTDAGLNTFYINPQQICNQYECTRNADGSYNINLTLYFKAQSYVYLGGIISLTTLAGILSYLLGYTGRAIYLRLRTKSQKNV